MKKTPNIERRTPNAERMSIREGPPPYGNGHRTPSVQRRTARAERTAVKEEGHVAGTRGARPKYDLEDRLLDFAVKIVELTETLPITRAGNHIAGQLLRSGTSPYGHHGEVESAESLKDFVHKLKVCLKELRETRRWLRLVARLRDMRSSVRLSEALNESDQLIRIFVASIRTVERKRE